MEQTAERKRGRAAGSADYLHAAVDLHAAVERYGSWKEPYRDLAPLPQETKAGRSYGPFYGTTSVNYTPVRMGDTTGMLHAGMRLAAIQPLNHMVQAMHFAELSNPWRTAYEESLNWVPEWPAKSGYEHGTYRAFEKVLGKYAREALKSDPEECKLVLEALNNPKFQWRTVTGIVEETGLSSEAVTRVLGQCKDQVVRSSRYTSNGRELYATRTRFRKFASPWTKILGALKNRAD